MTTPEPPSSTARPGTGAPAGPATGTPGSGPVTGTGPAGGAAPAGRAGRQRPGVVKRTTNTVGRVLLIVVGALIAIFAIVNLQDVEVDWIFGRVQTPLILALVVALVAGIIIGWLAAKLGNRGSNSH